MRIDRSKVDIQLARQTMTMKEAAERAGISRERFYTILGQRNASPKAAGHIARGLGVDVTEIIETEV